MSDGNGNCAAVAFGISGANTASPFDGNARNNTGTNGIWGSVYITTSNANDFIIGALGVENGNPTGLVPRTGELVFIGETYYAYRVFTKFYSK